MTTTRLSRIPEARKSMELLGLLFLTAAAILVHGYHPFAEDAEIYLPGIEKMLHPQLFPSGTEFFQSHAHLTIFPNLIAISVRVTHLPFEGALFCWYAASIFLLLFGCWQLAGKCFASRAARWAGVAMVASLLTLPVAGTALYIMDQYTNPRDLAAFAGIFAVSSVISGKFVRAGLWLLFAALVHPLMSAFAISLCVLLIAEKFNFGLGNFALLSPIGFLFQPTSPAYHEAVRQHAYFYLLEWQWYEWLGILAPIVLFWWFGRLAQTRQLHNVRRLCRTLILYDLFFFAVALVISVPQKFEALARLEPLRSLHLLYILMLMIGAGFLGEYVLKSYIWRWLLLFVPLCGGMFLAQRALFRASHHVEWPGQLPKNPWALAFLWVRGNTPVNAEFALDPAYMRAPGEDEIGFRALAERSRLADESKDSGAVSMFPPLAGEWLQQVQAQRNWTKFTEQDFERLQRKYGVSWVVVQNPAPITLHCPYRNPAVSICRLR